MFCIFLRLFQKYFLYVIVLQKKPISLWFCSFKFLSSCVLIFAMIFGHNTIHHVPTEHRKNPTRIITTYCLNKVEMGGGGNQTITVTLYSHYFYNQLQTETEICLTAELS